jgi:hypothetical protein
MNPAAFHDRLAVLGLSVRRFAAMTGVQYATARHWGVAGRDFPRWVPLTLEMMDPTVSMKPPNDLHRAPQSPASYITQAAD